MAVSIKNSYKEKWPLKLVQYAYEAIYFVTSQMNKSMNLVIRLASPGDGQQVGALVC
ncbi:hypothetical protein GALL_541120 [mine drainage metagenome]|uniref:Uncharacterized protein n=1 Tax=mine drainage metagenome TaxID=410659 RepID=A0A1J5NZX8_9ZZZZ